MAGEGCGQSVVRVGETVMTVDIYTPRTYGGGSSGTAGRITPVGPYFVDSVGAIVTRKSITGFTAPKRFATGEGDKAKRYFDFVMEHLLNEVRVFTRVDWTGPPGSGVESGWQYNETACKQTLDEAHARNLRIEMVAHTGKYGTVEEMANHLRRVDELCLAYENALLEVYNEPQQNGGHDLVQRILELYTPRTPGWMSGCYDPTPYTLTVQTGTDPNGNPILSRSSNAKAGNAMTYHSPRKDEWSRCFKDAFEFSTGQGPNCQFSPGYPGAVMLDEPPQVEQTIRDAGPNDPRDDWRGYGAGSKFFGCGGTMHSNPTLQKCEIPTDPTMLACIDAFVAGFEDVPTQRYHGYERGTPPGSDPGSRRYFRWGDDGKKYEICIRPYGFKSV